MQAEELQEDEFLVELLRASEGLEEETDELDDTLQALASMEQEKKDALEKSSLVRRYATALALKALVLYGSCAQYVKQWAAYISSFIYQS